MPRIPLIIKNCIVGDNEQINRNKKGNRQALYIIHVQVIKAIKGKP
jgi:hypothetical protein